MSTPTATRKLFQLDSGRFAAHVIAEEEELFGFDTEHERGFAAAISSRFHDAKEAEAIQGPEGIEINVYAVEREALIVTVRERELPPHLDWPLRQIATFCFDVDEVARYGDASFEGCRASLAELLDRANSLLPDLSAIRAAEAIARN